MPKNLLVLFIDREFQPATASEQIMPLLNDWKERRKSEIGFELQDAPRTTLDPGPPPEDVFRRKNDACNTRQSIA
jgi:hypothetical protein